MNYQEIIKKSKCITVSAIIDNLSIIDFTKWSKYTKSYYQEIGIDYVETIYIVDQHHLNNWYYNINNCGGLISTLALVDQEHFDETVIRTNDNYFELPDKFINQILEVINFL